MINAIFLLILFLQGRPKFSFKETRSRFYFCTYKMQFLQFIDRWFHISEGCNAAALFSANATARSGRHKRWDEEVYDDYSEGEVDYKEEVSHLWLVVVLLPLENLFIWKRHHCRQAFSEQRGGIFIVRPQLLSQETSHPKHRHHNFYKYNLLR